MLMLPNVNVFIECPLQGSQFISSLYEIHVDSLMGTGALTQRLHVHALYWHSEKIMGRGLLD